MRGGHAKGIMEEATRHRCAERTLHFGDGRAAFGAGAAGIGGEVVAAGEAEAEGLAAVESTGADQPAKGDGGEY